jgi:uncharacterized membrane-anchored protein
MTKHMSLNTKTVESDGKIERTRQSYVPVDAGPIQGSILTLTLLSAIDALFQAFRHGWPTGLLPILFLLNGLGFLALLIALYHPRFAPIQRLVRWVLIVYAAVTFIVWIFITHASFDPFDYQDKLIGLCLIVLLLVEDRQLRQETSARDHFSPGGIGSGR